MNSTKSRRRIVVVGGLAAGPSAAAKAVRVNPNAQVALFEATDTVSYGICEAPYVVGGEIVDEAKLVVYSPERLYEEKGIQVRTQCRVEKILPTEHSIIVRDLQQNHVLEHPYDKLIVATGASPRQINVGGENGSNVFHTNSRRDTLNILNYLNAEAPERAVIIGGGYVGMEMAEALRARKLDVTLLHRHKLPMAGLEQATR